MKKTLLIAAAAIAFAAAPATAGGFKYGSIGGSFGTFSYADGAAGGNAATASVLLGKTYSNSAAETLTGQGFGQSGAAAISANESGFIGLVGTAHSGSSAVAGSGTGFGIGGKFGFTK